MRINSERMRLRRLELRMSQMLLAEKAGISQSVVTKLENGRIQGRARDQQEAIARALGMTAAELCGEVPVTSPAPAHESASASSPTDLAPVALSADDVLMRALDKERHAFLDVAAVRSLIDEREPPLTEPVARQLLDAAAALRGRASRVTPATIAVEVARRAMAPTKNAPSRH